MQKSVSQSSMEAELVALTECSKSVVHFRGLLSEMNITQPGPTMIDVDNQSCIQVARSTMTCYKNRHVPIKYFFVKDLMQAGEIEVQWVASADNTSDLLTKCVTAELFAAHQQKVSTTVRLQDASRPWDV